MNNMYYNPCFSFCEKLLIQWILGSNSKEFCLKPHKISTQSDNRWKKSNYQLSE